MHCVASICLLLGTVSALEFTASDVLDADGDGRVTAVEFETASDALMHVAASVLDPADKPLTRVGHRMQGALFALLDSDGDKKLDEGELSWLDECDAALSDGRLLLLTESLFGVLDEDTDGTLSPAEIKSGKVPLLQRLIEIAEGRFPHPSLAFPSNSGTQLLRLHSKLQLTILPALDANGDGSVSRAEARDSLVDSAALRSAVEAKLPASKMWAQVAHKMHHGKDEI